MCRGVGDPFTDREERGRPDRHGTRGEREYDGQAVTHPALITRVRHLAGPVQQARDLAGYGLGVLAQPVKGRRDR